MWTVNTILLDLILLSVYVTSFSNVYHCLYNKILKISATFDENL